MMNDDMRNRETIEGGLRAERVSGGTPNTTRETRVLPARLGAENRRKYLIPRISAHFRAVFSGKFYHTAGAVGFGIPADLSEREERGSQVRRSGSNTG